MIRQKEQRQQDTERTLPPQRAFEKLANYSIETPEGKKDRSTEAINGYLRRKNLSIEGSREQLMSRVRDESGSGPEELEAYLEELERIKQAVQTLRTYPRPMTASFLRAHDIGANGHHDQLLEALAAEMYGGKPALPELTDYVDALAVDGPQHVFLFRLRELNIGYLKQLRDSLYIHEQLARLGQANLYNSSEFVWEAALPRLAAVSHQPDPDAVLLLKWVETRRWQEKVETRVKQQGGKSEEWELRQERSVDFFRVNLKTGEAELRIQKLHPSAQKPLRDELQTYSQLLQDVLQFECFRPVVLEPVIRRLIASGGTRIEQWKVTYPLGPSDNKGVPSYLDKLKMRFLPFSANKLNCYWPVPEAAEVHTLLRAKGDEVEIPNERTPEKSLYVLEAIRGAGNFAFGIPQLEQLAGERPEWDILLRKVDIQLSRLCKWELDVEKFAEEEWLSAKRVKEAMQEAKRRHPDVLQLKYRMHCPVRRRPAVNEGKVVEFEEQSEVPREVECQHGKHKKVHPTEDNIRPTVIYRRPAARGAKGLMQGMLGKLVRVLSGTPLEQFIKGVLVLVFSIPCLALLVVAWWVSENLGFGTEWKRLTIALVFLLEAGAIYKVTGSPPFKAVVEILKEYLRLFSPEQSAKS